MDIVLFRLGCPFFVKIDVTVDRVGGKSFKSTRHGLGANFLNLFNYTMDKYGQFEINLICVPSISGRVNIYLS